MVTNVLLVSPSHVHALGLRAILREQRGVHLIGMVHRANDAVQMAGDHRPNVIFVAIELDRDPTKSLIQDLWAASPASQIIMVSSLQDDAVRDSLISLSNASVLLWEHITPETVRQVIGTVLAGNLGVYSRDVIDRLHDLLDRRQQPRMNHVVLDEDERAVLLGLAEGRKQQEIAKMVNLSEASVERIVRRLKDRFGVASLSALCVRAGQLRLVD